MPRTDIPAHMVQVTEKENDPILPKYYYRCGRCGSFSAPNLYFPRDKYEEVPLEYINIPPEKRELNRRRVALIGEVARLQAPRELIDLGSGEGAFTREFVVAYPSADVLAVETDRRLYDKFYRDLPRVRFVPEMIDDFLGGRVASAPSSADLVVLTDVLEHLIHPERTLSLVSRALGASGVAYLVVPNSETFASPAPRSADAVDWRHANRTCQHLWMYEPAAFRQLVERWFEVIWSDDRFETDLRRDSAYTAMIVRPGRRT